MAGLGKTRRAIRTCKLILFVAIGFLSAPTAGGAEKITLRLDWLSGPEHSPIYRAIDEGYFKAAGVEVKVFKGKGSNVAVKLVGNKTNTFALTSSDVTLIARTKGLRVKNISQIYQKSPAGIMSLAENPVRKIQDLKGKKVGMDPKSTIMQQFIAALRLNKMDRSSLEEIPVGRAVMQAIITKKVDAAFSYSYVQPVILRNKGYKIHNVIFTDWGLHLYSMGLITHDDVIAKNPKLVRGVVGAIMRSYYDAKKDPSGVLKHYLRRNPKAKPFRLAFAKESFPMALELIDSPDTDRHGLGWSTRKGWEATQNVLFSQKLIDKKIDVGEVFTTAFLPGKP